MIRNPSWTRDELILALDLYFRAGRKQLPASDPQVIELSRLLNLLPIHSPELRKDNFRNPHGVSMKLGNFLAVDPEHTGVGLRQFSKLDEAVWDEFAGNVYSLSQLAANIRRSASYLREKAADSYRVEPDEEGEFPEGRILTRLHKEKERNRDAVRKKKQQVLAETGKLACEVCGFDFAAFYGPLGYGFAECHHLVPIASLEPGHRTQLDELAIVCSNCHRMLHKSRPMLSVPQLRELIMGQPEE